MKQTGWQLAARAAPGPLLSVGTTVPAWREVSDPLCNMPASKLQRKQGSVSVKSQLCSRGGRLLSVLGMPLSHDFWQFDSEASAGEISVL